MYYVGYWANDIATPELTWEKTRQFDVGLDFSMFNHRLSMSVDYFDKRTTDALLKKTMPNYKGGASYWVNDGEISNRGVDISLTAHLIQHKNFTWSTTVNGTYLKNRVEKLAGGENYYFFGSKPASGMVDEASIIKPGMQSDLSMVISGQGLMNLVRILIRIWIIAEQLMDPIVGLSERQLLTLL